MACKLFIKGGNFDDLKSENVVAEMPIGQTEEIRSGVLRKYQDPARDYYMTGLS